MFSPSCHRIIHYKLRAPSEQSFTFRVYLQYITVSTFHSQYSQSLQFITIQILQKTRVWKGIIGIRDLTKIWCGIRESAKYIDQIRDLTAPWETGFAKIWARDAIFFCLSVATLGNCYHPNQEDNCGMRDSGRKGAGMRDQEPHSKPWKTSHISFCCFLRVRSIEFFRNENRLWNNFR